MVSSILITLLPLLGTMALAAPSKPQARTDSWSSDPSASYEASSGSAWDSSGWSEPKASYESSGWSEGSYDSSSGDQWQDQGYGWSESGSEGKQSWDQGGEKASATTVVHETTLTTTGSWETPKHGSGSMPAGDLQSCLNTCHAQFGGGSLSPPASSTTATAAAGESTAPTKSEGGGVGAGATHTVVVAPTKGVLRFVPFAIEGNEGDTVEFIWGAGPHTVTMSDGQNVCNKSTATNAFDSGKLNATQTFSTKITTSSPQFHYCTVGTHCTAGMFGIINPPKNDTPPAAPPAAADNATSSSTSSSSAERPSSTAGQGGGQGGCQSVDCWVNSYAAASEKSNQTVQAVKSACNGTPGSWAWGGAWDMSTLVSVQGGVTKDSVIENMLYSRLMLAMNPDMMTPGAPVDVTKYNAPPPLSEFIAASGIATDSASNSGADASAATPADAAATTDGARESTSADADASKEAANAGSSTSGAAQTAISSIMLISAMSLPAILLFI
ncbi:hypothetical protein I317_06768 [Kwoniella heveanensis CBS 569]|nr:hypothetical protein I317_06768 [Kwoniella heveanensis CBS 569]